MRHSMTCGSLLITVVAVVAAVPARADSSSSHGGRGNMPASATPTTTTQSVKPQANQRSSREPPAQPAAASPAVEPNMPAASSATTTAGARSEGIPRKGRPSSFEQGTIVELGELAPVEVIDLQERLKSMNLYPGEVDGIAGPQTRLALHQYFAKQAQLALDGKLNKSAMALLADTPMAPKSL